MDKRNGRGKWMRRINERNGLEEWMRGMNEKNGWEKWMREIDERNEWEKLVKGMDTKNISKYWVKALVWKMCQRHVWNEWTLIVDAISWWKNQNTYKSTHNVYVQISADKTINRNTYLGSGYPQHNFMT